MADTGFSDLLENIYAPNTGPYLMSGKAVNQSTRAHQLVATVLSERLISPLISNSYAEPIQGMITKAMEGQLDMEHLSHSQVKVLEEID